jgi:RNA polymerase sigma factor for flagellar operon FliA
MLAERIDDHRLAGRLDQALAALDQRERELVRRHYFDGEPVQDIARDLGISRAWASRLHARALARLRDQLAPAQTGRARQAAP